MGWSRGAELLRGIVTVISEESIEDDIRSNIYEQIVEMFEDFDCDDFIEVADVDPIMDAVLIDRGWLDDEDLEDEEEDELDDNDGDD